MGVGVIFTWGLHLCPGFKSFKLFIFDIYRTGRGRSSILVRSYYFYLDLSYAMSAFGKRVVTWPEIGNKKEWDNAKGQNRVYTHPSLTWPLLQCIGDMYGTQRMHSRFDSATVTTNQHVETSPLLHYICIRTDHTSLCSFHH